MREDLKPKPDDESDILDTTVEGEVIGIVGLDPAGEGLAWRMKRKFEQAQDQADREAASDE
jgi:hypothetical protein